MLRKELLQSAQTVISAGLLGEGVKVVFDATVPHADLTNRVMHLRPLPDEVSEEALLHLRADCDHEMGHFGFTDPSALDEKIKPLVKLVANSIEDGFIERKVSDRWLGCSQNLASSNEKIRADLRAQLDELPPSELLNAHRALAINGLQMLSFGATLESVYATFSDVIAPVYVPVADLLPRLANVRSTADSLRLAREFVARWRWEKDPPPTPPTPSEVAGSAATEGQRVPGGGGEPKKEKTEKTDEDREEEIAAAIEPLLVGTARKAVIANHSFSDHHRYRAYTDEDEVEILAPEADAAAVAAFVQGVKHVVPPLRKRLIMEFSGIGQRYERNRRRGQLDQRALHKVALGSDRIFRVKVPEIILDADLTLLVDASGSMLSGTGAPRGGIKGRARATHVTKLSIAAETACAFSMVLDHIGVSHECAAFTTTPNYALNKEANIGAFERVRPLRHLIVKPAGMTFRQCRGRFAALAHHGMCVENVDGEAVLWAARRLAARNRPGMKAVLIVISDGMPASSPEDHRVLNSHLKRTVARVEEAGVLTLAIGIGTDSVKRFYRNHTVIEDVKDLVGTGYKAVRAALRAAQRRET